LSRLYNHINTKNQQPYCETS